MKKTIISKNQLNDASGMFAEAMRGIGLQSELRDDDAVPRPTMEEMILSANYAHSRLHVNDAGAIILGPDEAALTAKHPGLRGIAHYRTRDAARMAPAIVLRDGRQIALLVSDVNPYEMNELKHGLLESLYVTQREDIAAHGSANQVAPMIGGHALIAASFTGNPSAAHDQVHNLANSNFGRNFDMQGNRDISFGASGHDVLRVRSAILRLSQVIFEVPRAYQISHEDNLLGNDMTAGQLNIALTVAATLSSTEKRQYFDPRATMEAMSK